VRLGTALADPWRTTVMSKKINKFEIGKKEKKQANKEAKKKAKKIAKESKTKVDRSDVPIKSPFSS
jgi:hypothetical protein